MSFWHIVRVIKNRSWLIVSVVVITTIVIFIAAPKPKIAYRASALVQPTPQVMLGGGTTTAEGNRNVPDRAVILSNLIILAQSGDVYQKALDFLALPIEEQKKLAPDLPDYKQITRIELSPGELLTYGKWMEMFEVTPVNNPSVGERGTTTDIIQLSVKLPPSGTAPYLANAIAYSFSQVYIEKSREDSKKYAKFLESSKNDAGKTVKELQNKISEYKATHNVISVNDETTASLSSLTNLELQKMAAESEVKEAQAAVSNLAAQISQQPNINRIPIPVDMDPRYMQLSDELLKAEAEMRILEKRYKPGAAPYDKQLAYINNIKKQMTKLKEGYLAPTVNQIRQDLLQKQSEAKYKLATATAKLQSINKSLAQAQEKMSALAKAEPELADLMREYNQAEKRYQMFSERHAQALITQDEFTKTGSIVPYSWARPDAERRVEEGPSRKALIIYGFILSLIAAIATAIWLDSIDNRMRNAHDVEKLLELPVIGLTPSLQGKGGNLPKLTHVYPLSSIAESYRILRTNILFALRDTPFKTLMVATGRPGQGATTTICNLAISLAQIGKKIILIDADMRRPSLHNFFNVPNEWGLSTMLQGKGNFADALQQTDIDNLIVVPAGPQPINPSELLGSEKMRDIVKRLETQCDLVLFDTPSTVVFSDGPMLASWIDAVIMVVSANQVPRGTERETRDLLRRAKANILGVVVNRMSHDNVDSCYYYSHYYADSALGPIDPALTSGNNGSKDKSKQEIYATEKKSIPSTSNTTSNYEKDENPFPN